MNRFLSLFTHNWGLKLIALILAIIVFYWVRGSIRGNRPTNGGVSPNFMKGPSNANTAR